MCLRISRDHSEKGQGVVNESTGLIGEMRKVISLARKVTEGDLSKEALVKALLPRILESTSATWTHFRAYDAGTQELHYQGFVGSPTPGGDVLSQRFPIGPTCRHQVR